MEFKEWLAEKLREKNLTQAQLASLSGINQSTISRYLNGEIEPPLETWLRIGRSLDIEEKEILLAARVIKQDAFVVDSSLVQIPLLPHAIPCGTPVEYFDDFSEGIIFIPEDILQLRVGKSYRMGRRLYAVRARGDSMIGEGIRDGDYVIFCPDMEVEQGDVAAVEVSCQGITIKKVRFRGDEFVELHPANEKYEVRVVRKEELRVLGKVIMDFGFHR